MAAQDNLQPQQFMSVAELSTPAHWDRNMGTPDRLYAEDRGYIDKMAQHIREHGSIGHVQVYDQTSTYRRGVIHDGHHRVIAEGLAGNTHVPVKYLHGAGGPDPDRTYD